MRVNVEVLRVLDASEVTGNSLTLPGQLDRKIYTSVNKVLEAAGWKWNRKAKAHLCDGDAVEQLEQVLLTGEVTVAKNEFGYFPTPPDIVDMLIERADIKPGMRVLEPSAGTGSIADAIAKITAPSCYELLDANFQVLQAKSGYESLVKMDFLQATALAQYDRVVMNPPFSRQQDIRHVTHAFEFLKPGGRLVAVMSAGVQYRDNRLTRDFRELVDASGGYIEDLPEGAFKSSGTMVRTVMVVMDK